jgi:hypothetical protein
LVRNNPTTTQA